MLFNSWIFVGLVLITFFFYYLPLFKRLQNWILIISSFIFYSYTYPRLLILLLFTIFLNAVVSYFILFKQKNNRWGWAFAGVTINLLILIFFKYSAFFTRTWIDFFSIEPGSISLFLLGIPLPIGISFFTFQGISLVVDSFRNESLYRGSDRWGKYLEEIALFKSFFPQLVAGPIVKAHEFLPQIKMKHFQNIDWKSTIKALILGYFLKMVVADNLKETTFYIAYPYFQGFSSLTLLSLIFGYSMQIFSDFAGYSLIAIGLGHLFGYQLPINFNFPYISRSFSEFWTRWHISLSTWLRLYLYIPLGGNRKSRARTYLNLMIVMFLGGLWHGAAWSYAVWGVFHGLALVTERFFSRHMQIRWNFLRIILVFSFVTLAWLLFKLPRFGEVIQYLGAIIQNRSLAHNKESILSIGLFSIPVIVYHFFYEWKTQTTFGQTFVTKSEPFFYALLLFLIIFNSGTPGDFIYFQF